MSNSLSSLLLRFLSRNSKFKITFRNLSQGQRQIPREKPALRRRSPGGSGYPLLIIPITTFGLGTWQIQRRGWKLDLIKSLEEKMNAQPRALPEDLEELKSMEYHRVKVKGTFDHSRELFIGPRSNILEESTLGTPKAAHVGVNVVTPLKLSDRNETILVNRGYVTSLQQPPQLRKKGQIEGEVEIIGIVRLTERKSILSGDPKKDGYWLTRNVEEMAEVAETSEVFLDADANSTVPGGPLGGQTRVSLRNEHMTYIITWYTLCALSFYMWYKTYRSPVPHKSVIEFMKREHKKL